MNESYRIQIKGHLDPNWTDWLGEMTLTHQADGTTLLAGPVVDQPALHGLLGRINSLGLTLLLVEQIEPDNEEANG
ncbi:MAG: hypothetical protein JSW55_07390 [Chloroflexota bacterium]|nr:MAG: hypothetical protein JSW55_07390 [Chloroflexota bacterium]